jgi:hypothetical protein
MIKFTTNTAVIYNANIGKGKVTANNFDIPDQEIVALESEKQLNLFQGLEKANEAIKKAKDEGKAYIGYGALKRLKTATNVLFETAKHQGRPVNLLTLTMPSEIWKKTGENINTPAFDKEIKRQLLPKIIHYLKTEWKCNLYVYRAETQDKGRIHFHLLIDCFVGKVSIKNKWNTICSYYLEGVDPEAPSTRIDGIENEEQMSSYVMKYLTKGAKEGRRNTGGRQWGSCDELKEAKLYTISDTESSHAMTAYYLEDLHINYSDSCKKFYCLKGGKFTEEEPANKFDIVCVSYRFNPRLFNLEMPKEVIELKNKYYKDYSKELYSSINEKIYSYKYSPITRKAFAENKIQTLELKKVRIGYNKAPEPVLA